MIPVRFATAEDGNNIGVVHCRRRRGLSFKLLQCLFVQQTLFGQHFDCDATSQRFLFGFKDDSHSATADFANDPIVTKSAQFATSQSRAPVVCSLLVKFDFFDRHHQRQHPMNFATEFWMPARVLVDGWSISVAISRQKIVGQKTDRREIIT